MGQIFWFTLLLACSTTFAELLFTYKIPVSDELKQKLGYAEGSYLNFTALSSKYGYTTDEHNVTTEDGYIRTIFRMKSPNCTEYKRTPVLLVHGAAFNADQFLQPGRDAGWPYLLSDDCYVVWVENARGNNYGRTHLTLNPDKDAEFWDYSTDEMGYYDIPSTIDYILNTTGTQNLTFMGYSQGGQIGLITLADRPEYNEKINLYVGLGPSTKLTNMRSVGQRTGLIIIAFLDKFLQSLGIKEIFHKNGILQVSTEFLCHYIPLNGVCNYILSSSESYNPGSMSVDMVRTYFSHITGTSVRTMAHFGQTIIKDKFLKYDFGTEGNLVHYGNSTPPGYNLTQVTAPSVLLVGLSDMSVYPSNIDWLAEQIQNVVEIITLDNPFNHIDYANSAYIPTVMYPRIEAYIDKYGNSS